MTGVFNLSCVAAWRISSLSSTKIIAHGPFGPITSFKLTPVVNSCDMSRIITQVIELGDFVWHNEGDEILAFS